MKRLLIATLMALCGLTLGAASVGETCVKDSLKYKGEMHEYWVYVPEKISQDAPLLLTLHGYGGNAERSDARLTRIAEEHGFVLCFPQGLKDGRGKRCWNVGYPFQEGLKRDDVGFIEKLVRHLQKQYGLKAENAFLSGMSNGGEMCYLMAQRRPELFAGIMSIAGLTLCSMGADYRKAVPFMEVHGTSDKVSRWEGDPIDQYHWGAYMGVPAAVSCVVAGNKCISYEKTELPLMKRPVVLHRYHDGAPARKGGPSSEVWFYEVVGGKHDWALDSMDTLGEMWRFMEHFMR